MPKPKKKSKPKKKQVKNEAQDSRPWDSLNKRLFNHPEVLNDFLQFYLKEDFISNLDISHPEPLPSEFITEKMRKRYGDFIRKLHWQGEPAYLLLLLEFQTDKDIWIPIRFFVYTGLLWLDLIEKKIVDSTSKLPPVLPIVIFSGKTSWTGPLKIADLISNCPEKLKKFQPEQTIILFNENDIKKEFLLENSDFYAMFVLLKRATSFDDFLEVIEKYQHLLIDTQKKELEQTFLAALNTLSGYIAYNTSDNKPKFSSLEEAKMFFNNLAEEFRNNTIQQRLPQWREDCVNKERPQWREDCVNKERPQWKEDCVNKERPQWKEEYINEQSPSWKIEFNNTMLTEDVVNSIARFFKLRFGSMPNNYKTLIGSINDINILQKLRDAVFTMNSLNEFDAVFDKVIKEK